MSFQTELKIDTQKIVLSSECEIEKTESFISQTKYICDIDFFVSKIAEGIIKEFPRIFTNKNFLGSNTNTDCYKIETDDKAFTLLIKFGFQIGSSNNKNIIFYQFSGGDKNIRQNDLRIQNYLSVHKIFKCNLISTKDLFLQDDFAKLYKISNSYGVDFPKLSAEQLSLVQVEDQNVVIQGVAGSGKTNVCIDKLIWVACKNYSGKVLYTTFSRGLIMDTKLKVEAFKNSLVNFVNASQKNNILFVDSDHKKAIENKLGIFFFLNDDDKIIEKIKKIIDFLTNKVDYCLFFDLYKQNFAGEMTFVDENYFVNVYAKNIKNHQLHSKLQKIQNLSLEVVYKEIYGLLFGFCDQNNSQKNLTLQDYISYRQNSFSTNECETIYLVAQDYLGYMKKNNLIDNNSISKQLLQNIQSVPKYSLAIVDEVQDFTELNLFVIKKLALKVFCAGDALQMINPAYFSFGYLKNLLYEKDVINVAELKNNYRNTEKIQQIIDSLGKINIEQFGTHNFVLNGKSIENGVKTTAIFCKDNEFGKAIANEKFENFTIVVTSNAVKESLRKILKNQEILTVAEIKGLERNTVVLYNILSDNYDKWQLLSRLKTSKKQADENSVFRYYFNLFYVGISRARQNLFVIENKLPLQFKNFVDSQFECENAQTALKKLSNIVSKLEFTQDELVARIEQFIRLEQFDNAKFTANKLGDDKAKVQMISKIEIYESLVHFGKYREAGIKFWEIGEIAEAKKQFMLSGDTTLIDLIDAVSQNSNEKLNIDIVKYFEDVGSNEIAKKFILETITKDLENVKNAEKELHKNFANIKEKHNGK